LTSKVIQKHTGKKRNPYPAPKGQVFGIKAYKSSIFSYSYMTFLLSAYKIPMESFSLCSQLTHPKKSLVYQYCLLNVRIIKFFKLFHS